MNSFFRRLGWLTRRRCKEDELREELEFHLNEETEQRASEGLATEEAKWAARRELGNTALVQEDTRASWGWTGLGQLAQDVRFGMRVLRKSSGYSLVALFSLALGIGASTAMFSVVYGVLIAPYPYGHPNEIWAPLISDLKNPQQRGFSMHPMRDFVEIKKLPAWSEVMATRPENRLLTGDRDPENFTAVSVTANTFQFIEVPPILGRSIQPYDVGSDGQPARVIALSYKAWQRLFAGSASALGQSLILNEQPFTVIGVMPPRFGWWTDDGGWLVLPEDSRDTRPVAAIMRLNKGVSAQSAEEQLQALHVQLAKEYPDDFPKAGFTTSLQNYMNITVASGAMESSLRLLFGAVGLLLLIACANVANLQLARGTSRAHELAVRMSIGAGRARLVRQLLTESVVLSFAGGVLGIVFAYGITQAVTALIPNNYVPNEARITVNLYVLLFSAGISLLSGILFGLAPALKCSRPELGDTLKEASRTLSGDAKGDRTRKALVVAEIALSVVLLSAASLTVQGFLDVQKVDLGFRPEKVLVVGIQVSPSRYSTYDQRIAFSERLLDNMASLPGVASVALGNGGLPFGGPQSTYSIEGQAEPQPRPIQLGLISADYAKTMGIPLRAGRELQSDEVMRADAVALINESAAKLWPQGISPIGRRIHIDVLAKPPATAPAPRNVSPMLTVVGVIADTRNAGRLNPPAPAAYIPYTLLAPAGRTIALRAEGNPLLLIKAVRQGVRSIDKNQPLGRPITMEEIVGSETVQPRFNVALFAFFGAVGLALAMVGIYSTLSYTVSRRTHEIGIRLALGSTRGNVLWLILSMGGKLVAIGLGMGLTMSLMLVRLLRSAVIQVPAADAGALIAVIFVLCFAAIVACLVPAQRAAHLDPMSALRHD